jgi:hypothetical protein
MVIHVYARGITITSIPTILRLDLYVYCHCLYPDCLLSPISHRTCVIFVRLVYNFELLKNNMVGNRLTKKNITEEMKIVDEH